MIKHDKIIANMINADIIECIAQQKGIDQQSARKLLSEMSFSEYTRIIENQVVPPSGNTISPKTAASSTGKTPDSTTSGVNSDNKPPHPVWAGKSQPIVPNMTVGISNDGNNITPMQVTQVDNLAHGVKVKDPTTGKEQWQNQDALSALSVTETEQDSEEDLERILKLAGLKEMSSGGAVSAGAIASSPTNLGAIKKRQPTEETVLKKEYTAKSSPKTIIGDTKPGQASGELSANLAASGKSTASRSNAGFKR